MTTQTTGFHFCPVCRRPQCGHLLPRDTFGTLAASASTPLDLGVARFAAEVFALVNQREQGK
jgi:hypothetical protein